MASLSLLYVEKPSLRSEGVSLSQKLVKVPVIPLFFSPSLPLGAFYNSCSLHSQPHSQPL